MSCTQNAESENTIANSVCAGNSDYSQQLCSDVHCEKMYTVKSDAKQYAHCKNQGSMDCKIKMTVVDAMGCTLPLHDHHTSQQQTAKVAGPKDVDISYHLSKGDM